MIFRACPPTIIIGGLRSIILGVINSFWYILRLWRFAFQIETFLYINQASGACDKDLGRKLSFCPNMAKMMVNEATAPDVWPRTGSVPLLHASVNLCGRNAMFYILLQSLRSVLGQIRHAMLILLYKKSRVQLS